jgi:hypothetical protein
MNRGAVPLERTPERSLQERVDKKGFKIKGPKKRKPWRIDIGERYGKTEGVRLYTIRHGRIVLVGNYTRFRLPLLQENFRKRELRSNTILKNVDF